MNPPILYHPILYCLFRGSQEIQKKQIYGFRCLACRKIGSVQFYVQMRKAPNKAERLTCKSKKQTPAPSEES